MTRHDYYQELKAMAREVREKFSLVTPRVMLTDLRRIYMAEGVRIDLRSYRSHGLRGAYFYDDLGSSVMICKNLPTEPRIFTMGHELKHHLVDRDQGPSYCGDSNLSEAIEIGAEVFSAELIFPDEAVCEWMRELGVDQGECTREHIVHLKDRSKTTLSYAGLVKKAEWLEFAEEGALDGGGWKRLQEKLLGIPLYKQIPRHLRGLRKKG